MAVHTGFLHLLIMDDEKHIKSIACPGEADSDGLFMNFKIPQQQKPFIIIPQAYFNIEVNEVGTMLLPEPFYAVIHWSTYLNPLEYNMMRGALVFDHTSDYDFNLYRPAETEFIFLMGG